MLTRPKGKMRIIFPFGRRFLTQRLPATDREPVSLRPLPATDQGPASLHLLPTTDQGPAWLRPLPAMDRELV